MEELIECSKRLNFNKRYIKKLKSIREEFIKAFLKENEDTSTNTDNNNKNENIIYLEYKK